MLDPEELKRKCWKSHINAIVSGLKFLMRKFKELAFETLETATILYWLWWIAKKL